MMQKEKSNKHDFGSGSSQKKESFSVDNFVEDGKNIKEAIAAAINQG